MKCKKCGNKIPFMIEICPYCGYEFHATHHQNVHNDNTNTTEGTVHADKSDDTQSILTEIENIKNTILV